MSRYQRVPVKDLIVDERYQRPLDEKRVAKIAGLRGAPRTREVVEA